MLATHDDDAAAACVCEQRDVCMLTGKFGDIVYTIVDNDPLYGGG